MSAVITERGTISCEAVILAGGAWTGLFCASLGVRLPQLKVLSSVMRTAPVADGPDTCTYMNEVAYRKRLDGGYTMARVRDSSADGAGFAAVPREFLPTLRKEPANLNPLNAQSFKEWRTPRRWALDRPTRSSTPAVSTEAEPGTEPRGARRR